MMNDFSPTDIETLDTATIAAEMLRKAADRISGPRQRDYGDFKENCELAAHLVPTTKGITLPPVAIGMVMQALKRVRLRNSPTHQDTMIDLIGYTALEMAVTLKENTQ